MTTNWNGFLLLVCKMRNRTWNYRENIWWSVKWTKSTVRSSMIFMCVCVCVSVELVQNRDKTSTNIRKRNEDRERDNAVVLRWSDSRKYYDDRLLFQLLVVVVGWVVVDSIVASSAWTVWLWDVSNTWEETVDAASRLLIESINEKPSCERSFWKNFCFCFT